MLDVEKRQECLKNGKFKDYMMVRSALRHSGRFDELFCDGHLNFDVFSLAGLTEEDVVVCERIRQSVSSQRDKVEEHISFYIGLTDYKVYFATFTFSDDTLSRTSPDTRKQKIRRLISSFCDDFLLNIDFGSENEREHYHAVLIVRSDIHPVNDGKSLRFSQLDSYSDYGFYNVKQVSFNHDDADKLSAYLAKLTMHSVKVKQSYISVKKGSPYQMWQKLKVELSSAWLRATDPRSFGGYRSIENTIERVKNSRYVLEHPVYLEWLDSLSVGSLEQLEMDWFTGQPV